MKSFKSKFICRLLAAVLVSVLILSQIPVTFIDTYAAATEPTGIEPAESASEPAGTEPAGAATEPASEAAAGQYIRFEQSSVSYVLGENNGTASALTAVKASDSDGEEITYSISESGIGLSCNKNTGEIKVSDYHRIGDALINNGGTLDVEVTADKAGTIMYPADKASYILTISFLPTPADTCEITGTQGSNGWYTDKVNVTAKNNDEYKISSTCDPEDFKDNISFSDQGAGGRYVFLKNTTTGGITNRILLDGLKIDTVKPDTGNMKIEYSEPVTDKIIEYITFGYYKPSVNITFTAEDASSGIDHFDWTYTDEDGVSDKNKPDDGGSLTVNEADGKAVATLTLTAAEAAQYRGHMAFTATDKAGNTSSNKTDTNHVVVVDTISPTRTVTYNDSVQTVGTHHYFNNDVVFKLNVNEANFYKEDVTVKVSKNGGGTFEIAPTKWVDNNVDEHEGTYTLEDDGDYIIYITYTDRSGNEMQNYQSDLITIDKTAPVLGFHYDRESQKTTFTVAEHNFNPENITVAVDAKDINGDKIAAKDLTAMLREASWSQSGDVYTFETDDYIDGIYNLTISYQGISDIDAVEIKPDSFAIDHEGPFGVKIEYSKSLLDTILETVTRGYYKADVTVTFTAYDTISGVKSFTWNYIEEAGSGDVDQQTDTDAHEIAATQDNADKTRFTATVKIPDTEAEQLRGYLAVFATDRNDNRSDKFTDEGNIIVVDTIAPSLKAEYSEAARTIGTTSYYNGDAAVTFTVTEANFYAEDVRVQVSKNGEAPYTVAPAWKDNSMDEHVGTYTLTGYGSYVITVNYKDRSENEMTEYTSDTIIIDTVKPVVDVKYANKNIINAVKDRNGNNREYYDSIQTATIAITEQNFDVNDVQLKIIAEDAAGQKLDADSLSTKSAWTDNGNIHTITINYPGDANYTFDVEYADLAGNEADDYTPDYFTVDKTAPENLSIKYSTSVLDTVLESVSFGFYNAKMTVSMTAEDATSGVREFLYSYMNAPGISPQNAELINQAISDAEIHYSNNGRTAKASFEIPRNALAGNNQFNGTVKFTAADSAGHKASYEGIKRIVVDNITPTAQVSYNKPVRTDNGISYYSGKIDAAITVNEANFYANDVVVTVSKDGGAAYAVTPAWSQNNRDTHIGTFTISGDGDYIVNINYADKSGNRIAAYTSGKLTVDTDISEPVITINGSRESGQAYRDEVIPAVSFEDENFEDYEIILTRTRFDDKNVNVTDSYIGNNVILNEKGGSGTFDKFDKIAENDGIYTLTAKMTDKAGHSSEAAAVFTVNRFGSVYEYSDYLASLIKDGGAYVRSVTDDLVITEYNSDRLVSDSLDIRITRDGKPVEGGYEATPAISDQAALGESGWFQYQYTISKDNFTSDGIYKIAVSSKDATGNTPENSNYEDKNIVFRVDSTAPEITGISGLEKSIIDAPKASVKYTVFDTIGLKNIKVFVGKKQINDTITDFGSDRNNYSGSFTLSEKNSAQKVRIVVEDLAGNVTDTNSRDFRSAYTFHRIVTVSTNGFVRWFANKPLFWGTIGTAGALAAAIVVTVIYKRRRINI